MMKSANYDWISWDDDFQEPQIISQIPRLNLKLRNSCNGEKTYSNNKAIDEFQTINTLQLTSKNYNFTSNPLQ